MIEMFNQGCDLGIYTSAVTIMPLVNQRHVNACAMRFMVPYRRESLHDQAKPIVIM